MEKNETRDQILDAAIELFWSKSYHGVNMNELSRFAGVNKATVYQHFGSKEDVALASVKRAAERTVEYLFLSTFAETDDPKERIMAIYQKAYLMHVDLHTKEGRCRGCPFVNIGVELATSNETVRAAVMDAFASFRPYYGRIVEACFSANENDSVKQQVVTNLLNNMNSCLVASKLENRPEAILDGSKQAIRILAD